MLPIILCFEESRLFDFTYFNYVLTQRRRNHASFLTALQSLRACFTAPWGLFMARIAVLAHRLEFRIRMVRPDVCRFHPDITVLAICNCISGKSMHPGHLPHSAPWLQRLFRCFVFQRTTLKLSFYVITYFLSKIAVQAIRADDFIVDQVIMIRRDWCAAVVTFRQLIHQPALLCIVLFPLVKGIRYSF